MPESSSRRERGGAEGAEGGAGRAAPALAAALALALLLLALCLLPPWQARHFSEALDDSWVLALNEAFAAGRRFGREVVFTFGPYGFVWPRVHHPATGALLLLAWAATAAALWALLVRMRPSTPARLAAWAALSAAALPACVLAADGAVFSVAALLLALRFEARDDARVGAPAAGVLGLAALVKFTFFMASLCVVAVLVADGLLGARGRERRFPWYVLAWPAALLALWLAAGQRLSDLGAYVAMSLEISGGYSTAMSVVGPQGFVVGYAAVAAAFLGYVLVETRAAWPRRLLYVAGLAGLLFLLFKAGFVRQDGHESAATVSLFVIALFYGAVSVAPRAGAAGPGAAGPGLRRAAAYAVVLAGAAYMADATLARYDRTRLAELSRAIFAGVPADAAAAGAVLSGRDGRDAVYARSIEGIRRRAALGEIAGAVDLYPAEVAPLMTGEYRYAPRPVLQSYAAYTPELLRLNAAHLEGPDAAETVLFGVEPTDGRYAAQDDSLSWPLLLAKYDVAGQANGYVRLERARPQGGYRLERLSEATARWGEPVAVPAAAEGLVWAEIRLEPTALGRLAAVAFRIPPVQLFVEPEGGEPREYRLVPGIAEAGFLLSPVVENADAFASLALCEGGTCGLRPARSVRVGHPGGERWRFAPEVRYAFYRLAVDAPPAGARPRTPREALRLLAANATGAAAPPALQVSPSGAVVLFAHAPSRAELGPAGPGTRVRVRFGIYDGAWNAGNATDGVEFRVVAVADGRETVVWSRALDPVAVPADRGEQEAVFETPPGGEARLRFETLTRANGNWDWSYWSAVNMEEVTSNE